jgi:hypothetical protein
MIRHEHLKELARIGKHFFILDTKTLRLDFTMRKFTRPGYLNSTLNKPEIQVSGFYTEYSSEIEYLSAPSSFKVRAVTQVR